jgi:hypothetical protein
MIVDKWKVERRKEEMREGRKEKELRGNEIK